MPNNKLKKICIKSLEENKAKNLLVLDVKKISAFADTLIIVSATSNRHAKTLSDKLVDLIKLNQLCILGIEGDVESGWMLVDCGEVVVNIMTKETRDYYDLEGLWGEKTLLNTSA